MVNRFLNWWFYEDQKIKPGADFGDYVMAALNLALIAAIPFLVGMGLVVLWRFSPLIPVGLVLTAILVSGVAWLGYRGRRTE